MAENEGVAAPAATTESAPAPETVTEATPKPSGSNPGEIRHSARANARAMGEKYAQAREAAREKHHSQEQPRNDAGQFVEGQAAPAAEPTQVLDGSATAEATASTEAAYAPPAGMVRIELPEGHPLRDQGTTHLDVAPSQERTIRAAVNAAARRADVEAAMARVQEEAAARQRAEAQLRFFQEHGNGFWTPEDQSLYNDILQSYAALGPEKAKQMADAYKRGREAEASAQMGKVAETADLEAINGHWQTEGERFRTEALAHLPTQYPGVTPHEVQQAIQMYAFELQRVQEGAWAEAQHQMSRAEFERRFAQSFRYSADDFLKVAGDYLKTRPGVIASSQGQKAAQELRERQIRAEAEAAERERRIEAAQRHATNPQRALGGVSTGQRTTDPTPAQPDRTKMSPGQIVRSARDAARALGEQYGQGLKR